MTQFRPPPAPGEVEAFMGHVVLGAPFSGVLECGRGCTRSGFRIERRIDGRSELTSIGVEAFTGAIR
jgi:hypothetical protein